MHLVYTNSKENIALVVTYDYDSYDYLIIAIDDIGYLIVDDDENILGIEYIFPN